MMRTRPIIMIAIRNDVSMLLVLHFCVFLNLGLLENNFNVCICLFLCTGISKHFLNSYLTLQEVLHIGEDPKRGEIFVPQYFKGIVITFCISSVTCVFYSGTAFNSSFLFLYFWHWPILWLQYTWCDHAGREIKKCSLTCLCSCYLALWSVKSQSLSFQKDYQLQRGVSGIYQWRPLQCPQADKDLSPAVTPISPVSHFSLF